MIEDLFSRKLPCKVSYIFQETRCIGSKYQFLVLVNRQAVTVFTK